MTELKKSIGARSINEPGAKARHDAIAAEYESMVSKARKLAEGRYDALVPHLVTYLADNFLHCHLALDEASRWRQPPPEFPFETRRDYEGDYLECREMLSSYDADGLVDFWRDWATSYTRALGYLFDPATPAFASLCRELGEASCKLWLALDQRIDERHVATSEAPVLPTDPSVERVGTRAQHAAPAASVGGKRTFEAIALELIDNPRMGIREGVKEHVRTALRFIRETIGSPCPSELTQVAVGQLLDLMALRPAKLPQAEWAMSLPDLADRYRDRPDVLRMSARTMEVRLSALSTVWKRGAKEGVIERDLPNPFIGRSVAATPRREKTARGFSVEELLAYFSLPCFQAGERPVRGKGEAVFWLPLLALFTGARPEEVAQLVVSDIFAREEDQRWTIRFTDEGMHLT